MTILFISYANIAAVVRNGLNRPPGKGLILLVQTRWEKAKLTASEGLVHNNIHDAICEIMFLNSHKWGKTILCQHYNLP